MKNSISYADIKLYFRQNKTFYFIFFLCAIFGLLFGIVLVLTSDSYLNLATSDNKILFPFINGTVHIGEVFWSKFFSFFCPMLLIFLLALNFYSGLISYIFICYQSALFVMSMASVITLYGISGLLNAIFIMIPINLIYFCVIIFFSVTCVSRSYYAFKYKKFNFGFSDEGFYTKILVSLLAVLLLVILAVIIYPLFLKNTIFIIF